MRARHNMADTLPAFQEGGLVWSSTQTGTTSPCPSPRALALRTAAAAAACGSLLQTYQPNRQNSEGEEGERERERREASVSSAILTVLCKTHNSSAPAGDPTDRCCQNTGVTMATVNASNPRINYTHYIHVYTT